MTSVSNESVARYWCSTPGLDNFAVIVANADARQPSLIQLGSEPGAIRDCHKKTDETDIHLISWTELRKKH